MKELEKPKTQLYATFRVGGTEVGIDVTEVIEVVNFPMTIVPVPLAPKSMIGVFNLRGMIIPVLKMSSLLHLSEGDESNKKVAILEQDGVKLGLVFDSTQEILRTVESDFSLFSYIGTNSETHSSSVGNQAIIGMLKLDDGKRLIQIVKTSALAKIENLPHVLEKLKLTSHEQSKTKLNSRRRQCISFQVGSHLLALDISSVNEIIKMPVFEETPLSSDICLGLSTLRGVVVPLISLAKILGEKCDKGLQAHTNKKVIVMNLGAERFGLVIDQVQSIVPYTVDEVVPFPVFNKDRSLLISGCISREGHAELLLMDITQILSNDDISAITHGHSQLYQRGNQSTDTHIVNKASKKNSYITFYLENLAAFPILDVQEIIAFPKDLNRTPGTPEFIRGMLNLRGRLVSIVDLRKTYQMPDFAEIESSQVLIVKAEDETFGLVVDAVAGLITINQENKLTVPTLFQPQTSEDLKCDVKEYVEANADLSFKTSTMIFNLHSILGRIRSKLAA